jgi:hypothetical protein
MPYIIDFVTAETINVNQELKVNGIPITPSGGGSFTGGTVTGQTQFTNGLTATTISATTYQNLPGGGIEGSNYIYVAANGTDTENATELQTAYTTAVGLSPSATNHITVVCGPGYYNFGESTFAMDTQYIDLVSLDGNRSVLFNATLNTDNRTQGSISITANDVFVKGVDVGTKNFTIATNLNLLKVENCAGGDFSFSGEETQVDSITISGTFINCVGGERSFGYGSQVIISGTFTNCTADSQSFIFGGGFSGGILSGMLTNCTAGSSSFIGDNGTVSGTLTNCTAGANSFIFSYGTVSGTLIDCVGGSNFLNSYGGTLSGIFTNCTGGNDSFQCTGGGTLSGIFTNCTGGGFSFAGNQSGTFTDCTGGYASFSNGNMSGIYTRCVGGDGAFGYNSVLSGTFTNCIGGSDSFGAPNGTVSGTFNSCVGGGGSFAGGEFGTLSGKLYYCRLTSGNFQTVSDGGITRLCLDGSNVENNQG